MRPALFLLLFCLPALTAPPEPVHQVTFKAVTAFGEPVPVHVTSLADPLHHRDLAARCAGVVCTQIPEGPYRYSVLIDETGRKVEGTAVVYRTNQIIVVDVGTPASDTDEAAFPTITGTVVNAPDPAKVWIRLQQLYSDLSISAGVEKNGAFTLDEVRPGNWMLLVFIEGKLVHFEPFTCREKDNPPLRVNLEREKPLIQVKNRIGITGQR
jgi:hypothetical protein